MSRRRREAKPSRSENIRAALESLAKENGGILTPTAVVQAARNPDHVLHGEFTWNEKEAAEERWRDVARSLIRRYGVPVRSTTTRTVLEAPVYVKNPAQENRSEGYVLATDVASMPDGPASLYRRELGQVVALLDRMEALAVVSGFTNLYSEIAGPAEQIRVAWMRANQPDEAVA